MCRSHPKAILMRCRRMVCSKVDSVPLQGDAFIESARKLNEAVGKLILATEKKYENMPKTRSIKRRRYNGTKAIALNLLRQQKEIEKLDAKLDVLRRMVEDLSEEKDPSSKRLHSVIGLILLALGTASGCAVIDDRFKYYSNCMEEANRNTTLDALAKAITASTHTSQLPQRDTSHYFSHVTVPDRCPHRVHTPLSASHFGLYSWASPSSPPVVHEPATPSSPLASASTHTLEPVHESSPPLDHPMSPSPSYNSTADSTGARSHDEDFVMV
eukprot:TRINITY_DN2428_c1_g2_i1.p1 TRINITY_DN2428_c1_g2~~TRINITY_DN2428_c1_g2_i1.p1  ORF type:complete len:286 (+),score=88.31 TRINITY_DN2428_c1_g2_i1:46-858(+)